MNWNIKLMPIGGYNIGEGLIKRGERESFLNKHMSYKEQRYYVILRNSLYVGMITLAISFSIDVILLKTISAFSLIMGGSNLLNSVVRQLYRRYLLIKYKYPENSWFKNTFLTTATYIFIFVVSLFGLFKALLWLSQFM